MSNKIYLTANDTLPTLQGTWTDLTDATVTMHIAYDTPLVKTATIADDPTTGVFTIEWESGDLVAGTWDAEIQVVTDDGTQTISHTAQRRQLQLVIREEIA